MKKSTNSNPICWRKINGSWMLFTCPSNFLISVSYTSKPQWSQIRMKFMMSFTWRKQLCQPALLMLLRWSINWNLTITVIYFAIILIQIPSWFLESTSISEKSEFSWERSLLKYWASLLVKIIQSLKVLQNLKEPRNLKTFIWNTIHMQGNAKAHKATQDKGQTAFPQLTIIKKLIEKLKMMSTMKNKMKMI